MKCACSTSWICNPNLTTLPVTHHRPTIQYHRKDSDDAQLSADVAEGAYASVAGVPFAELPASGQQFVTDYEAKYGPLTEPYSVYGCETMSVALRAIEDVCAAGGAGCFRVVPRASRR